MTFEQRLSEVLRAPDPAAALVRMREDPAIPEALRRALRAVDEDGLRMTALMVSRLRFERLVQGSPRASSWFADDPRTFSRAFKRYHAEVVPTAFFPAGEAAQFEAWFAETESIRSLGTLCPS